MKLVGGDGRTHINSRLMRESLQDRDVLSNTDSDRDLQIFPDVSLVSIGGQSIFDRGKDGDPAAGRGARSRSSRTGRPRS